MNTNISIIKQSEVLEMTRQSPTTLWRQVKEGVFTPPIRVGGRSVGYIQEEVQAILSARSIGVQEEGLKQLVKTLIERRKERASKLFGIIAA